MNIEEAIEILKEFIEVYNASYPEEKEWVAIYPYQIEAIQGLLDLYNKEKEENKRLRKCHLQYEEMTGIDLLLPSEEE